MRLFSFMMLACFYLLNAQTLPDGNWQGSIEIGATKININLHFLNSSKAAIDIPQQNAIGIPLQNVKLTSQKVYFELPAGPGLAIFDGTVFVGEIRGSFTQGAAIGSFFLSPMSKKKTVKNDAFDSQEISFSNGFIHLAGTLLLPKKKAPYPAVVLVTGSGQQNRDEEIFGFKIFKQIAESLATQGIAVLRYNDRGFAPSTGDFKSATTADLATDALAAVKFLRKKLPVHNQAPVGILGHSEGAVIATLLAGQQQAVDFIILMAGPAIRGDHLLKAQSAALIKAAQGNDQKINTEEHLQDEVFKTIRRNMGWDALQNQIADAIHKEIDSLPEKTKAAIPDVDGYVKSKVAAQMATVRSPWMKWYIDYDPALDLRNIHIPVLALFGGKDLQVPFLINQSKMQEIFTQNGNIQFTPLVFADANHLFQKAGTGSVQEYAVLKKEFVPGFLPKISRWILQLPR